MRVGRPGQTTGGVPARPEADRPNAARIYDYLLGGSHNFAADRAAGDQAAAVMPELPLIMRAGRAFLRRSLRHLVAAGVDQFLDLGSGIPTAGNVHEVVQQVNPQARVVYVDIDLVAVACAYALLVDNPRTTVIHADLRAPDRILADPQLRELLDLARPVGVIMSAVLHFVPDADDPAGIVAGYRDAIAPGSYLILGHAARDDRIAGQAAATKVWDRTATPLFPRTRDQIAALLADLDLVQPGLVPLPLWRPDGPIDTDGQDRVAGLAAVARKPG
jgi:SAM-dependent methyltransferase